MKILNTKIMNTFITYDKTGGEICNTSMLKYKLIMPDKN